VWPSNEAFRGNGGIAPLILNLRATWWWVANFMPRPLYLRERSWYPLNRWVPEPVWTFGKEKNVPLLPGFQLRTIQPVVCSLYWLDSSISVVHKQKFEIIYYKNSDDGKMKTRNYILCRHKNLNTNKNMSRPSKLAYLHYSKFDTGRCHHMMQFY